MLTVPEAYAGQQMKCPLCTSTFTALSLAPAPVTAAPTPNTAVQAAGPPDRVAGQPPKGFVACEKCAAQISHVAENCPQCGHPQPKRLADEGRPNGLCGFCGTLNLLHFDKPSALCRGCGQPLKAGCAEHYQEHRLAAIFDEGLRIASEAALVAGLVVVAVTAVVWTVFVRGNPFLLLMLLAAAGFGVGWAVRQAVLSHYLSTTGVNTFKSEYPDVNWYLRTIAWWRSMSEMHKGRYMRKRPP
jgi:hypothetical protein